MTLAVVHHLVPVEADEQQLPTFEGEVVDHLRAKLSCTTSLELGSDPHHLDATARLLVTGRVVRVDHVVDGRSGRLVRVETFKVIDARDAPNLDDE